MHDRISKRQIHDEMQHILEEHRKCLKNEFDYDLNARTNKLRKGECNYDPTDNSIEINMFKQHIFAKGIYLTASLEEYFDCIFTLFHEIRHSFQYEHMFVFKDKDFQFMSLVTLCESATKQWYWTYRHDSPRELDADLYAFGHTYAYLADKYPEIEQWLIKYINKEYHCDKTSFSDCFLYLENRLNNSQNKFRTVNNCQIDQNALFVDLQEYNNQMLEELIAELQPMEICYKIASAAFLLYSKCTEHYRDLKKLDLKPEHHFICKRQDLDAKSIKGLDSDGLGLE